MSAFDVFVEVSLKEGIADPEGATIERALPALGFDSVSGVRVSKGFRFRVDAGGEQEAAEVARDLSERLLSNPVISDARISVSEAS